INTSVEKSATLGLSIEGVIHGSAVQSQNSASVSSPAAPLGLLKVKEPVVDLSRWVELLGQKPPVSERSQDGTVIFELEPGAAYCLSPVGVPRGLQGEDYRRLRAQAAWGLKAISTLRAAEMIPQLNWRELADAVNAAPRKFLARLSSLPPGEFPAAFLSDLAK